MKPMCSVGTNEGNCVTKLHTVNAELIPIALHSRVHSLHVPLSDTCSFVSL